MKKIFFYTLVIIFSFTALNAKNGKHSVNSNMLAMENVKMSANDDMPATKNTDLTIIDNTSASSGIPANLPADAAGKGGR